MSALPKILVTRHLPTPVEARLSEQFDVVLNNDDRLLSNEQIISALKGFDGLLAAPTDNCDAHFIAALPESVKILATFSVGYDHIDIPAAEKTGLTVTNTPDVLTDATADLAILLMLGAARGAYWGDKMVRDQNWKTWSPTHPLGIDVTGRRLGILGMGRIGRAVAKRARAFDMKIHYHNRSKLPDDQACGAEYHTSLQELAPHCDFLSIHCGSTPQTRGSLNQEIIKALPDGAVVINTARGDIVNDDALINALQSGKVAAAGLDVFNNEPDIDPRYRTLDNVFLLPHLGSATPQTRIAMGMRAVDNLEQFFAGRTPRDQITGHEPIN